MKTIKIPFTNKVIVDRKELEVLEDQKLNLTRLASYVVTKTNPMYYISESYEAYVVFVHTPHCEFPIKAFPLGLDQEYARLCAEELCEMLNSKM